MKFDMSLNENFAAFHGKEKHKHIFVDSFDNMSFEVRIGTLKASVSAGTISASSDEELNTKLKDLYEKHIGGA